MPIFTCRACSHHFNSDSNKEPKCPKCGVLFKENEDLPAPLSIGDLPAPASSAPLSNPLDLPAPKSSSKTSMGLGDLPAPALNEEFRLDDLPAPKSSSNDQNLPAQKPGIGKLPGPGSGGLDLPAPIAMNAPPPVPSNKTQMGHGKPLAADAMPALELSEPIALGTKETDANPLGGGLELDNPLDNSLDLSPAESESPMELSLSGGLELDAPTEGGQDLSGLLELDTPIEGGQDLSGLLEISPSTEPPGTADFDLGGGDAGALDLDDLGLETPSSAPAPSMDLGDAIELPEPETGGVVSFSPNPSPSPSPAPRAPIAPQDPSDGLTLDMEPLPGAPPAKASTPEISTDQSAVKKVPKRKKKEQKKKLPVKKIAIGAVAATLLVGGVGFLGLKKFESSKQASAAQGQTSALLKSLSSSDSGHWAKAKTKAKSLVVTSPEDSNAFALKAETHYAALIATGLKHKEELKDGAAAMATARKLQATGVNIQRAEALQALAEGKYPAALKKLESLKGKDKSKNRDLYLAWAYEKTGQPTKAQQSAESALKSSPENIDALVVLANSFASLEKKDEAIETYNKVLKLDSNHIGSLVGVASLADIDTYSDRENRFLEILKSPNLKNANPRDVSLTWLMTGHEALRAERLNVAEERYTKALSFNSSNLDAMVGQAKVMSQRGKNGQAIEKLDQVLSLDENHIESRLTLAEVFHQQKETSDAASELDVLIGKEPPITNTEILARMQLLRGNLFASADGEEKMAEEAYLEAIKLAGEKDLRPTLALTDLYASQGRGAEAEPLLKPVRNAAMNNPALAASLGVAYMKTKNLKEASFFFEKATQLRPDDADAKALLGKAYFASGNTDGATKQFEAAHKASNQREDIALELASHYDRLGRFDDAEKVYDSLLSSNAPSDAAASFAGRFYTRRGQTEKARTLGEKLLQNNPESPAGLFLKGESYFIEGNYAEARDLFVEATVADPQPQFLEAAGRASAKVEDFDAALKYFDKAIHKDPEYLKPRIARASLQIARKAHSRALNEIDEAMTVASKLTSTSEVKKEMSELVAMKGLCLLEKRDFNESVKVLKTAISQNPSHSPSHYYLGKAYSNLNKQREAANAFGKATSLPDSESMPWYGNALKMMGYAHREAGNIRGAIKAWEKYVAQAPVETVQVKEVRNLLTGLK